MASVDFWALEAELLERLRASLSGTQPGLHLLGAADLAGVTEERQLSPAVHVIYQGYQVLEQRGKVARLQQTWLVVVATRNVRALKAGAEAGGRAGLLAGQVMQALMGWQPPSAAKPLALSAAPGPRFQAGHQYLPLAFSTELVLKAPT
ncbi:hypothetical protein HNQ51_001718 [Inhella inkyongensis]|uniref:Uncharacterized protein n=1 Tax=Inhella inkyongensis TaxID=392593 RepID=A0A840S6I8_9BURK|nr:hypothetical protein [Inhella inkyongensis]MBB5204404.1 hypothetical protein [Inhella inkyongensis]